MAVPTERLQQGEPVAISPKATFEQLKAFMAQLPAVYDQIRDGARTDDFRQMRHSHDAQTQAIGNAYYHLFAPEGIDHRLEAEVVEGRDLIVTRGRHRVEAALELGLPYVPVHVRAADDRALNTFTRTFEETLEPTAQGVVYAQRELDAEHQAARAARDRSSTRTSAGQAPTRVSRVNSNGILSTPASTRNRNRR
ncbi:ParB N-terminal domain-containing protein [Pseudarthrobacter siccitolerans]|uniref:hypothetical protein n=1 Tax=Pseudarthrobacter siccitolerans TaxID=861266 RepID=UPI00128C86F3|nr:hypothetical protein [Pseudarthrobacter siccitolerans]